MSFNRSSDNNDKKKKILILIEDGSFLFDNRVKREAGTLKKAGFDVFVICPRYPKENKQDVHDGVQIYRYNKWNFAGHAGEYFSSLIKGFLLAMRIWRLHGFDCIHACNPPDLWFIVGAVFKALYGVKFVFDHHDVCPELFLSRFQGRFQKVGYFIMLLLERMTFRLADGVISTNESYKKIAMARGGIREQDIRVVRNGPDLEKFQLRKPVPSIKKDGNIVVGYVGNMNPQDGVENLVLAAKKIVYELKLNHYIFILIGKGDSFNELIRKKHSYHLDDYVVFTGRIDDEKMLQLLSSCDICVQPDPKNALNDVSTMNKAMEYMALGKPVVAFDLIETRFSCDDCALYAKPNSVDDLSDKIVMLGTDSKMRMEMGRKGRKRIEASLAWRFSEDNLIELYNKVLSAR